MTATRVHTIDLVVLDVNKTQHWNEVHKAGCKDLAKTDRHGRQRGHDAWSISAHSRTDAARIIGSDFLQEGSMTLQDVLDSIHFAPCVSLPLVAYPYGATPTVTLGREAVGHLNAAISKIEATDRIQDAIDSYRADAMCDGCADGDHEQCDRPAESYTEASTDAHIVVHCCCVGEL